jgi:hypothetical protein
MSDENQTPSDAADEAGIREQLQGMDTSVFNEPEAQPTGGDEGAPATVVAEQASPQTPPVETGAEGQPASGGAKADKPGEQTKQEAKPAKPDSPFVKAQKEQARLAESWKKLNEEKEAWRRQREQEGEQARQAAQRAQAGSQGKAEEAGRLAAAAERMAKRYAEEGDEGMAEAARAKALEYRQAEQAAREGQQPTPETAGAAAPQLREAWNANLQRLVESDPKLREADYAPGKNMLLLLNHQTYGPALKASPQGINMAYEVARLMDAAGQTKALQEKLTKAEAEVRRLTKLTAIGGATPASATPASPLEGMSDDNAEAFLRKSLEGVAVGELRL